MAILRVVFFPLTLLVNLISNLLYGIGKPIIEFRLYFNTCIACEVEVGKVDRTLPHDRLLISSYIMFLLRFFRICDTRQVQPIRDLLAGSAGQVYSDEIALLIYHAVLNTLSKIERAQAETMFLEFGRQSPPVAVLPYKGAGPYIGKCKFKVIKNGVLLSSNFKISASYNLILLPLAVGVLYDFVCTNLNDKGLSTDLNTLIIHLVNNYDANALKRMATQEDFSKSLADWMSS